jgi:hypothetical protein
MARIENTRGQLHARFAPRSYVDRLIRLEIAAVVLQRRWRQIAPELRSTRNGRIAAPQRVHFAAATKTSPRTTSTSSAAAAAAAAAAANASTARTTLGTADLGGGELLIIQRDTSADVKENTPRPDAETQSKNSNKNTSNKNNAGSPTKRGTSQGRGSPLKRRGASFASPSVVAIARTTKTRTTTPSTTAAAAAQCSNSSSSSSSSRRARSVERLLESVDPRHVSPLDERSDTGCVDSPASSWAASSPCSPLSSGSPCTDAGVAHAESSADFKIGGAAFKVS